MIYNLELKYHTIQNKILFDDKEKVKVITKGRRFGFTKGLSNYVIENLLIGVSPILWVDTTYPNIIRYYDRYFYPELRNLPKGLVKFDRSKAILLINGNICDFRSAEREQNLEGYGYKIIILNEAGIILKKRAIWEKSIRPMTFDFAGKMIIGGTPKGKTYKGEKHLFFELFEKAKERKDWKAYQFTSYDNPFIDRKEVKEYENEFKSKPHLIKQEVYGEFISENEYNIIKPEWIKIFIGKEYQKEKFVGIYQSWDTAFKTKEENDYSVCSTWILTNANYYLIDLFRDRLEFPDLKKKVIQLYEKYKANQILIEDKASGQSLIQELRRETRLPLKEVRPDKDKIARLNAITPLFEAGKVKIRKGIKLRDEVINELIEFPSVEFDDITDSISQALNVLKSINSVSEMEIKHVGRKKRIRRRS